MISPPHWFDRFPHGAGAQAAAFVWGLAEATVFFIVPDVWLTVLGCRSIRAGLKAALAALLGALAGGLVMYSAGRTAPASTRAFVERVPGIQLPLIQKVEADFNERSLAAVLLGPLRGIPYKIFAEEWGARRGSLPAFLTVSIPARGTRFGLGVLLAGGIARLIAPWTQRRARTEMLILAVCWISFYSVYFAKFGW